MAKQAIIAQLTRRERLRRVVLLCCGCLRNIAYYRAGWDKKTAVFSGELQVTVNGNFIDMAVLDWCKLFGGSKELHHWGNVLTDEQKRPSFKKGLLADLKCTAAEWNAFRIGMLEYRHEFLAIWTALVR